MSDRLPREPRRTNPDVAAGKGHPGEGPGVNGSGGGGSAAPVTPDASPLRFLPINGVLGGSVTPDDVDNEFAGKWPALWEYVTCRSFRGQQRVTSTLLFFREDGQWKLCVSDRDCDRVLFRSGESIEEALDAAEKALASPRADWRASKRRR